MIRHDITYLYLTVDQAVEIENYDKKSLDDQVLFTFSYQYYYYSYTISSLDFIISSMLL